MNVIASIQQTIRNCDLPDLDLVLALQSGQTSALGILYHRHAKLVYNVALKILSNSEEAEDLTQEIFIALQRGNNYDYKRSSLRSFLVMVTRSRSLDRLRVRNNRVRLLQRWQHTIDKEPSSNQPTEYAVRQEQSHLIRQALEQLPATERQALEIAYYEGLSQSQLAERLNIPLGTVKTRSRKGLMKLRQILQENGMVNDRVN